MGPHLCKNCSGLPLQLNHAKQVLLARVCVMIHHFEPDPQDFATQGVP